MKHIRSLDLSSVVSYITEPVFIIRFYYQKLRHSLVRLETADVIRNHVRSITFVCDRTCREHLLQNIGLLRFKLLRRKLSDVPDLTIRIEIDRVVAEEQERLINESEMRRKGVVQPREELLDKIRRISHSTARVQGG